MEKDSSPYDIVAIQKDSYNNDDILSSNKSNIDNNSGEVILANKVLSTYKEKIIFQQEKIELSNAAKINIEEIRFENCKVIEESKNKEYISNGYIQSISHYILNNVMYEDNKIKKLRKLYKLEKVKETIRYSNPKPIFYNIMNRLIKFNLPITTIAFLDAYNIIKKRNVKL